MKRKLYILFITLILVLLPNVHIRADCECKLQSFAKAIENSSVIFVGRVESVRKSPIKKGQLEAKFEVTRGFRGEYLDEMPGYLIIYTPVEKDDCGVDFVIRQDYLVFASGNPAQFNTTTCSRTSDLDTAKDDINRLNRM